MPSPTESLATPPPPSLRPSARRAWALGWRTAASGLLLATLPLGAVEVVLQAPLSTLITIPTATPSAASLSALIDVPAGAPPGLGVGAWVADHDGDWFQSVSPVALTAGANRVSFALDSQAALASEPSGLQWNADSAHAVVRCGLFFYGAQAQHLHLQVTDAVLTPSSTPAGPTIGRLLSVATSPAAATGGGSDDVPTVALAAGARFSASVVPQPFPDNPYDAQEFRLDAEIHGPGGRTWTIPAFFDVPMAGLDRGDRALIRATDSGAFTVRFRAYQQGVYQISLHARWQAATAVDAALPPLVISRSLPDAIVHVDATDPRFFSSGAGFYWPIGLNLNSPYDLRSRDALGTRLTPDRGYLVYDEILPRLAAAGGTACEIWMASWNLALEWRDDWPGYRGIGRYNQVHAWELDQILDRAWQLGVRVNLVINNHGQASATADHEWHDNPWSATRGGPLEQPIDVFLDPAALAGQEQLRRYIIARYADSPAILGWKLWSEVDLTAARGDVAGQWHEHAAARWHALDSYAHPVTTHWAGDFRRVNPAVAILPGIDYLCIDAYRHADQNGAWRLLANILCDSATFPGRGLAMYGKPVLTTEYGAGAGAAPEGCRLVDHRTGAWAAVVGGHAGSPMLWWWEWVDQHARWQPYVAISRFMRGEDLRGGRSAILAAEPTDRLWSRAWVRPGRLLGYVLDARWGAEGVESGAITGAQLEIGDQVAAGTFTVQWWEPDSGVVLATSRVVHGGGRFTLTLPSFSHQLALKLIRETPVAVATPR